MRVIDRFITPGRPIDLGDLCACRRGIEDILFCFINEPAHEIMVLIA